MHISQPSKRKINYNKLAQYFKVQIRMSNKKDGTESNVIRDYEVCSKDDFSKLEEDQKNKVNDLNFLCLK